MQEETEEERVNVLLVDDRLDKLLVLEVLLAGVGLNLVKANSGKEALRCLLHQDFAVILLDVNMPGLDGFETAALIRQRKSFEHTPIIFFTSYGENDTHISRGYSLGAVDYIFTPVVPEILRAKIAVFVELYKKTEALRKAHAELEVRVEKRTAELAKTNQVLQSEINERKRVEESLAERAEELTRSNAELEQFAYVASHDLQEPLRMVTLYMQLLEKRFKGRLDSQADTYISYAVDGARRMHEMIKDLLNYSRVGRMSKILKPVECMGVLETVLKNLKRSIEEAQAQIKIEPLPRVMGDSLQLTQLFQNLIGNAIKFRGEDPPRIHVFAEPKENQWVISVRDNGIGIEPQFQNRIFQIFQRLHEREKYPGSGIGLAIARKIVEQHGGRIGVDSKVGAGSTFYFTIPALIN